MTERVRDKVAENIIEISKDLHYEPAIEEINGKRFPNNIALMTLSYILNENHLLTGDPGWGKTTSAQVVTSKFSGLPLDLVESLTIEGHPGQYEEKFKARPDYGKLIQEGAEISIWQGNFAMDSLIIDEANRLGFEAQDSILEGIRTGRWKYLNDVIYQGEKPAYLTINERDHGNNELIPPLSDRMSIMTAEDPINPWYDLEAAEKKRDEDLKDEEITEEILNSWGGDFDGLIESLEECKRGGRLNVEDKKKAKEEIEGKEYSNDAYYLLLGFQSEINRSQQYGKKRSSDPISDHTHDKQYAGVKVNNSFSARARNAAEKYSKGLAWLIGDDEVKLDHVKHVLPYVTAHKLDFTDDFLNEHGGDIREEPQDIYLGKELVEGAVENYQDSVKKMKDTISRIQDGKLPDADDYDHPLIKDLIEYQERERKQKCNL